MSSKSASRTGHSASAVKAGDEEAQSGSKAPLAASLLQEIQNFREKFKNEDEGGEKGLIIYVVLFFQRFPL